MIERFLAKVEVVPFSGCWIWTGALDTPGYGRFKWRGRIDGAHRASWEMTYGEIPNGLFVLHRCDVKSCVNPSHLFLGTNSENLIDCVAKGKFGRTRLTKQQVDEIRDRLRGDETQQSLADDYKVHQSHISRIARGVQRVRA